MIHPKDNTTALCFSSSLVATSRLVGGPPRNEAPRSSAINTINHDDILRDLSRARLSSPTTTTERLVTRRTTTNERPRRSIPLMSLSSTAGGPSLFESPTTTKEWKMTSSLLPLRTDDCNNSISSSSSSSDGAFPWHSALFTSTSIPSSSFSLSPTINSRPEAATPSSSSSSSMTGDAQLDERIRSFSESLRVDHHQQQPNRFLSSNSRTMMKKRRPRARNQATRYRLVGQVLGQKGIQKMMSTIKEIKQVKQQQQQQQQTNDSSSRRNNLLNDTKVLVDSWENAPTEDLKKLPWEEMLQTSLQHLEEYKKALKETSTPTAV